jgi:hypothetical protein
VAVRPKNQGGKYKNRRRALMKASEIYLSSEDQYDVFLTIILVLNGR